MSEQGTLCLKCWICCHHTSIQVPLSLYKQKLWNTLLLSSFQSLVDPKGCHQFASTVKLLDSSSLPVKLFPPGPILKPSFQYHCHYYFFLTKINSTSGKPLPILLGSRSLRVMMGLCPRPFGRHRCLWVRACVFIRPCQAARHLSLPYFPALHHIVPKKTWNREHYIAVHFWRIMSGG